MGKHSSDDRREWVGSVLRYVRTHKAQLATLSVVAVGLVSRWVPGFPAEEVLRVISAALGLA